MRPSTAEMKAKLTKTLDAMNTMAKRAETVEAYDQMIGEGNAEGNATVQAAIDGLIDQTKTIERVIASLDLGTIELEGSDSLDNPKRRVPIRQEGGPSDLSDGPGLPDHVPHDPPAFPGICCLQPALSFAALGAALADDAIRRTDLSPKDLKRVETVTNPTSDFSKAEPFERMQGRRCDNRPSRSTAMPSRISRPTSPSPKRRPSSSAMRCSASSGSPRRRPPRRPTDSGRCSMRAPARAAT